MGIGCNVRDACEGLRMSSSFCFCFLSLNLAVILYVCVGMLCLRVQGRTSEQGEEEGRYGYVGMFLRRLFRRSEPERAGILRHAGHVTADVCHVCACLTCEL